MEIEQQNRTNHKDCFVKATNTQTNEVKFYKNGMEASRDIGCSHVLAYKALNDEVSKVYGWVLQYIAKDAAECASYKKKVEDNIRETRQSLVEMVSDDVRKRNELIKEAKAQRKAEHDELVRTLRGWLAALAQNVKDQLESEAIEYRQAFHKYHAIVQLTMDGEKVREWDSAYQAEKATNIKNIRQVVLGLRKSAGGYRWEFLV